MPAASIVKTFADVGSTSALPVAANGLFTLLITGTFVATLVCEFSPDNGATWTPLSGMSYTAALSASNFLGSIKGPRLVRVSCTAYTSGAPVVTLSKAVDVLQQVNSPTGTPALVVDEGGIKSPVLEGVPTGLLAYDPGQIAVNSLRLASDVVSAETLTIGADVYEIEIVNTDSTDNTAGGSFVGTAVVTVLAATYPHLSTTLGSLIRVENELMRLIASGTYLSYSRGASGTTAATHADANDIYKADGVTAGRIAVGLVTTLTPTAAMPALVADINSQGTELVTAVQISVNELLLKARSVGAITIATTETLAGANNAWAATAMYGGKAQAVRKISIQQRVPKALDVTFGTMRFQFDFTPTLVQVFVIVTATPGIALAWDGAIVIANGLVTCDNTGAVDWATTNTLLVIATA